MREVDGGRVEIVGGLLWALGVVGGGEGGGEGGELCEKGGWGEMGDVRKRYKQQIKRNRMNMRKNVGGRMGGTSMSLNGGEGEQGKVGKKKNKKQYQKDGYDFQKIFIFVI